jgi:hypothetical protein
MAQHIRLNGRRSDVSRICFYFENVDGGCNIRMTSQNI